MASMNMSAWGVVTKQLVRYTALAFGMLLSTQLWAVTVNVVDTNGNPVSGFRWVLEEDATFRQAPGTWINPGTPGDSQVQSFNFYKSHMPVVGRGAATGTSATFDVPDANKHYYVSILPNAGFGLSGRPLAAGQNSVTVVVHAQPTPTAQIFVIAFHDNNPINNALDQPLEVGLGGFTVKIDDTLDQVKQDAFGNMLGTVYQRDANGNPVLDTDGNPIVQCPGNGVIQTITQADITAALAGNTCRNPYRLQLGEALIKNLHPSKYGVQTVPPTGSPWQQTSTIEGTKTDDAWVKANEPQYFAEFGPGVWHVAHGYVQPFRAFPPATGALGNINGRIVNMHMSRPPEYSFWPGQALDNCWVGLNESLIGGRAGRGLYAAPCGEGAQFEITNVPAGTYQLVMWDKSLLNIVGFHTVVVPDGGGAVALGDVPVFRWFGISEHYVYYDANGNGIRDIDPATNQLEAGIPEQAVTLRYRDGSVYQSMPTDMDGYVPFEKVFPFFFWQVAEVDFLRFKATGLTVTVDAGGQVDPSFDNKLNPQIQEGGGTQRTETGPVLTQAFQQFLGSTNVFEWGKQSYGAGENGGVSGIVRYATTRGENDPRFAAPEDWEPGIPHVQVNLYQDQNRDGAIDDVNGSGQVELADVDNFPFGWADGGSRGTEDVDRNNNGLFDAGTTTCRRVARPAMRRMPPPIPSTRAASAMTASAISTRCARACSTVATPSTSTTRAARPRAPRRKRCRLACISSRLRPRPSIRTREKKTRTWTSATAIARARCCCRQCVSAMRIRYRTSSCFSPV
jgi:large repetitive protein